MSEANKKKLTGLKFDTGKAPLSLIPSIAQIREAEVLDFGRKPIEQGGRGYGPHNWRGGMEWSRIIDATFRHMLAFADGEDYADDSKLLHLAHARTDIGFLIEFYEYGIGIDDRYKRPSHLKLLKNKGDK